MSEAIQQFQDEIDAWQRVTFPEQTVDGKLAHLYSEARELRDSPDAEGEWADVFILLLGAAALNGMTVSDLLNHGRNKFAIAKQRKWGPANADGFHHHIEEAARNSSRWCSHCSTPMVYDQCYDSESGEPETGPFWHCPGCLRNEPA